MVYKSLSAALNCGYITIIMYVHAVYLRRRAHNHAINSNLVQYYYSTKKVILMMKIILAGPRLLLIAVLLASQSLAKPASKMFSENNVKEAFLMGLQLSQENGQYVNSES